MGCGSSKTVHQRKAKSISSSSSSSKSHKKQKKSKNEQYKNYQKPVTKEIIINLQTLQQYIFLEKQIANLEAENVVQGLEANKKEFDVACRQIDQLNSQPPTPGDDYDTALENHNRVLSSLQAQKLHLEALINELAGEVAILQSSIDTRDDMLEKLFGGTYGSTLEDELEDEYNKASHKLGHVKAFSGHWEAAIVYSKKSYDQMSTGYSYWVNANPDKFPEHKEAMAGGAVIPQQLQLVADARSWLLAATTNLTSSVRILLDTLKVQIPYCHPPELDTLNKAIHHIFIDSRTVDRHHHAGKVYYSMGTRAGGLVKWLETVQTKNIQADLDQAENYAKKCQAALRAERLKLIRIQVADKIGAEALAEFDKAITEGNTETLKTSFSDAAFQANSANTASTAFSKGLKKHASVRLTNVKEEEAQTLPEDKPEAKTDFEVIPLEQLAAQPTRAQLYGEMFALIEESQETRKKLENIQDSEKSRQNQALQARLQSRRRRNVDKQ